MAETKEFPKEFPPGQVRAIVSEVAALLKERKETVSVAETVRSVPSLFKKSRLSCS